MAITSKIDTEGYELRELPWWYSPLTERQVHYDAYQKCYFYNAGRLSETRFLRLMLEEGFTETPALRILGEFERGELEERKGLFRVDQTKPTVLRLQRLVRYMREEELIEYWAEDVEEEVLAYTIIEKMEYMMIEITFSIETDIGHEIFFAEVHADTTIQAAADEGEIARRVVNAVLKLFFIVFDGLKVIYTAKEERDPQWMINLLAYLQSPDFDPAYERGPKKGMDGFLSIVMDRILSKIATEGLEYFLTRESFLAIGIEYGTADFGYEYPLVHVIVEKTRKGRWSFERNLMVAPTTDIRLDDILDMGIVYTRKVKV